MNEDMNRFDFNAEGKICDYGYEEPKVLSEQEILEELNRLDQVNYELSSECTSVNWTNECLQEQVDTYVKLLACKDIYENKIADLEAKLAESEEKCEEFKQVISRCTGKLLTNVAFDIANDDIRYQIICTLTDRNQEHRQTIRELKQQLSEKEKEIKKLKEVVDCVDKLKQFNADMKDYALVNKDVAEEIYCERQAKTDFAIEQLLIARSRVYNFRYNESRCLNKEDSIEDCLEVLDQQINKLKEKK